MDSKEDGRQISRFVRVERIHNAVRRTVGFVDEHYGESVVLAKIADELGISIFCLSRAFKRKMHVSFRQYLLQVRIGKARLLLRDSDYSITDIAQMVGFSDLPRFDKMFKQLVGTSPSRFRTSCSRPETDSNRRARNYYPAFGASCDCPSFK
jgi:two-component system, response regulator YesN